MTREEACRRGAEAKAKAEIVPSLKDVDTVEIHTIDDIKYPASREDVINAFNGFADIGPSDKEWYQSICQKAHTKMMMKLYTL